MIQAADVLAQLNHRYVVVGSTAIRLHGFAWDQPHDIDVWLDPTMTLQTGTQSSIRFRVRLIESGREVTTTVEAVSITRRDLSADPNSTLFTKSASSVQATLTTFLIVP